MGGDAIHRTIDNDMKCRFFMELLAVTAIVAIIQDAFGQEPRQSVANGFTGEKTSWHGFDRFDFLLDDAALTVQPIKTSPGEENGIKGQAKGQVRCVVVVPKKAVPGNPWSWRGRYFDHEPQAEVELLKRGFHIGFIQSDVGKQWDAWYAFLTEKHGLSKRPAFIGMSGGGRNAFTWATANPDKVSCIYADNPLITRESLMKLGELAQRDVPLLLICGSLDPLLANHTLPAECIYQQLGGRISVMIKDGAGHHPHSLRDPTLIADFIVRSLVQASGASPAFAGKKFTKSSFYGVENHYRNFPKEGMYITCRGPWFSDSYDRYEFKPDGTTGTVAVIAPRMAAPGKPWVFRADFVTRDALVDLALLHRGFHIVTGPAPRDTNGTMLQEWNGVYKYLIDQGFSAKPVMEGASRAAGEAYAWAIANPDKVSCIYGENPVLHSNMSKTQLLDNLAPLANVGVHLLHVCGSLDPWLKSQTRVVEKRYQELGGRITIIIKEGEGHYPLAPKRLQSVVDFIIKSVQTRQE
jgi:pimeloyl-ACP methyl ester carboxylesterase